MNYKSSLFIYGVITLFTINFISGKFYGEEYVKSKTPYYTNQETIMDEHIQHLYDAHDNYKYQVSKAISKKKAIKRNNLLEARYKQAENLFKKSVKQKLSNSIQTCNGKKYFIEDHYDENIHTFSSYEIKYERGNPTLTYFNIEAIVTLKNCYYLIINDVTEKGLWAEAPIDYFKYEGTYRYYEQSKSLKESYFSSRHQPKNIASNTEICTKVSIPTYYEQKKNASYVYVPPYKPKDAYREPNYVKNYFNNTLNNRTIFCDGQYYMVLSYLWIRGSSPPKAKFKENTVEISMSNPEAFHGTMESKGKRFWEKLDKELIMTYEIEERTSWEEIHISWKPNSDDIYRMITLGKLDFEQEHPECHDIPKF